MVEYIWHNTALERVLVGANHGESFSATCLTVSKNCTIVTSKWVFYHWKSCLAVYILLSWVLIKNSIVFKCLHFVGFSIFYEWNLISLLINCTISIFFSLYFCFQKWSTSDDNFNWFWTRSNQWIMMKLSDICLIIVAFWVHFIIYLKTDLSSFK